MRRSTLASPSRIRRRSPGGPAARRRPATVDVPDLRSERCNVYGRGGVQRRRTVHCRGHGDVVAVHAAGARYLSGDRQLQRRFELRPGLGCLWRTVSRLSVAGDADDRDAGQRRAIDLGESFTDTATVTGVPGFPVPTGTVTFRIYGPNNATCTGTPVFTSANRPLTGGVCDIAAVSRSRRPAPTGWSRATTATPTTTRSRASCGDVGEQVVSRRRADIATQVNDAAIDPRRSSSPTPRRSPACRAPRRRQARSDLHGSTVRTTRRAPARWRSPRSTVR